MNMRTWVAILLVGAPLHVRAASPPGTAMGGASPQKCECKGAPPPSTQFPGPDARGTNQQPLVAYVRVAPEPETKRLADLTANLVWATLALGGATFLLAAFGAAQTWFIRKQVRLGTDEFIATNRPRISLREAYAERNEAGLMQVRYAFANLGGTDAIICRSKFRLRHAAIAGTKRQVEFDDHSNGLEVQRRIEPGAHRQGEFTDPGVSWPARHSAHGRADHYFVATDNGFNAFYFFGRIEYKDDRGIARQMAFYRELEYDSYRFRPWDDPQLEYSDTNP